MLHFVQFVSLSLFNNLMLAGAFSSLLLLLYSECDASSHMQRLINAVSRLLCFVSGGMGTAYSLPRSPDDYLSNVDEMDLQEDCKCPAALYIHTYIHT